MQVSLNPLYLCNFRCSFCYLTKEQLSDRTTTPIEVIVERLQEINDFSPIQGVDLYGGEVGILDYGYLNELDAEIRKFTPNINVITNLSKMNHYFLHEDISLSVSWDYKARQSWEKVLENMMSLDRSLSVLMLATPELMMFRPEEVMSHLYLVPNLTSIEIKPYSPNQANDMGPMELQYMNWVGDWITMFRKNHRLSQRMDLENIHRIERSLSGSYNAFSDNHIYIRPSGRLAVLDFDENQKEYFREVENMQGYKEWSDNEKLRVNNNKVCGACKYKGKCLTEHYREVRETDTSCNGFRQLLDWYQVQ